MAEAPRTLPSGTVTFLFTDIERSTRLLERLGRERYAEVLARHRELLSGAVEEADGAVVDLQGDALLAVFSGAGDAVRAAVAGQRALGAEPWPDEADVRVRMGLHTGEAALSGEAYVGLAVHRGRRVCEAAHGGQAVLSSATRAVVGQELPEGVSVRDLGAARLAGFESPERLAQLVADGLPEAFPPPRGLADGGDARLLERDAELDALETALADARAGRGRLLAIEGPAGIGKTTLLAEARARASAAGTIVLAARGSELERDFSYGVVRQLFEPALARADAAERERLLGGAAAHAGRLFETAEPADGGGADENAAFAALHGLYWLTANLAERGPLVLAVDDLQWADLPSLRFVAYLGRRLEGIPVLVAASTRPPGEADAALEELLADPATQAVRPPALSEDAAAALVREALGPTAEDAFCAACHGATGGNPLLLRELLRTLEAEGVEPSAGSVDALDRIAPETVARAVRVRLARLPAEAAAVARAVAVLGDRADRAQVAALAGIDRSAVAPVGAQLARVDLLRPDPPLAFVHPVLLNAVYEGMSAAEREAAHARAAEVLAAAGAPAEQVAAQLLRAPAGAGAAAVDTLREAAHGARAQGAPESAVAYLGRALEEVDAGDERAGLLLELARAEFQLGRPSLVDHLREAARMAEGEELHTRVRIALARALFWSTREEEAAALLEELIAERPAGDDLARLLEAELIGNSLRLPDRATAAMERLAAIEVGAPDTRTNRQLVALQAYVDAFQGRDRDRVVERAVAVLDGLAAAGDAEVADWASSYIVFYALVWADAWEPAFRLLDTAVADARREGAAFLFSGLSVVRVIAGFHRGALEEAEADARAAYEALPHHRVLFMPQVHGWLAQTLVERGELDEAAEVLRSSALPETPIPDSFYAAPLVRARAALAAARGDAAGALAHALAYGRAFVASGLVNPAIGAWRSDAALAHLALGRRDEAIPLAREEVLRAREWGSARALGRALRGLGLVEGGSEGIELLREAAGTLEPSGAQVEHARALGDLGAALRRANKRAEARDHLRTALELAQRAGAKLLAERVHEELVATGARPRRLVLSGAESLTPSERRVAGMAADGMANREIAQALFVTPRTVEMHLSNAFRKLGIASRTQLAGALAGAAADSAA